MPSLLKSALRVGSLTVTVLLLGTLVAEATDNNSPKGTPLQKCLQKAGDQYRSAIDTCAQKNPTNTHDFGECLSTALTHWNNKVRYCLDTYPELGTVGGDSGKSKFKAPADKMPTMGVDGGNGGNGNGNGNGGTGFGRPGGNTVGGGDGATGGTGGGFGGNAGGNFTGAMEHATMASDGGGGGGRIQ